MSNKMLLMEAAGNRKNRSLANLSNRWDNIISAPGNDVSRGIVLRFLLHNKIGQQNSFAFHLLFFH